MVSCILFFFFFSFVGESVRVSSRRLRRVLVEVVDVCLAWVFLADSLSGSWCCVLVLVLGCVSDIGISMKPQVVGKRSTTAGEPGTYLLLETYT